jgi:beta-glucosidase
VTNTGPRAGDEVVQLYLQPLDPGRLRAVKELRGVKRLTLQPGETQTLSFEIVPSRDLRHYDVDREAYAVDPGDYEIQAAASSADVRLRTRLTVMAE